MSYHENYHNAVKQNKLMELNAEINAIKAKMKGELFPMEFVSVSEREALIAQLNKDFLHMTDKNCLDRMDEVSAMYIEGTALSTTVNCIYIASNVILFAKPENEQQELIQTALKTMYLPMTDKIVSDAVTISFYRESMDIQEQYFNMVRSALNDIRHALEKALEKFGNPSMALYCISVIETDMRQLASVTAFLGLADESSEKKDTTEFDSAGTGKAADCEILQKLQALHGKIKESEFADELKKILDATDGIMKLTANNISDLRRKVENYYLPTALKMLQAYTENISADSISMQMRKIALDGLRKIRVTLEQALNKLKEERDAAIASDLDAELRVLRAKIQADGLGEPNFEMP